MNQELVELQRGSATGAIILDCMYQNLGQTAYMDASIEDTYLFRYGNPIFKSKLEQLSSNGKTTYFVIRRIDTLTMAQQEKYIGLIKDREFMGYSIPSNVIIVFTVVSKESLKNIAPNLYQLCVVAF